MTVESPEEYLARLEQQYLALPDRELDEAIELSELSLENELATTRASGYIPNGKIEELIAAIASHGENGPDGQRTLAGRKKIFIVAAGNGLGKSAAGVNILCSIVFGPQNEWFDRGVFQQWPYPKEFWYASEQSTLKETLVGINEDQIKELQKWFPRGRYNLVKAGYDWFSSFTSDTGWQGTFKSYDMESKKFESATLGLVLCDEPPPSSVLNAMIARLRMGGIMVILMTPLFASAYVKEHFVDKATPDSDIYVLTASNEDACFHASRTEILSISGWKAIGEVGIGEYVATLAPNMSLEYQPVLQTIQKAYNGNLLNVGNDILATPDHRMLVFGEGGKNGKRLRLKSELVKRFKAAEKIYRGDRMLSHIPTLIDRSTMVHSPFPDKISGEDWCELLGWYIAEGSAVGTKGGKRGNHGVFISQNRGAKWDRIKVLLSRTSWKWFERRGDFCCFDAGLHEYLFVLGNSSQKFIPPETFEYPLAWLRKMLQAMLDGDGDGKARYVTRSERLANDTQRLMIMLGRKTSIGLWNKTQQPKVWPNGKPYRTNPIYCVYGVRTDRFHHVNQTPTREAYSGPVSCVMVQNGTIVVRDMNKRKPLITGNCKIHGIRGHLEHHHIEEMDRHYTADEIDARKYGRFMHMVGAIYKGLDPRHRHYIDPREFTQELNQKTGTPYKILHIVDPHDAKPTMMAWIAIDCWGTMWVLDEYPSFDEYGWFHDIRGWQKTTMQTVADIKAIEESYGWDPELIVRGMDPNFGRKRNEAVGMTTSEYYRKCGLKINWPMRFRTRINDSLEAGHRIVGDYIRPNADGDVKLRIGDKCHNVWYHMLNYRRKITPQKRADEDGPTERVALLYKDGADLVRYAAMLLRPPGVKEEERTGSRPAHFGLYDGVYLPGEDNDWRNPDQITGDNEPEME